MINSTLTIFGFVCCILFVGFLFLQSNVPQQLSAGTKNIMASVIQSQTTSAYDSCIQSFDTTASKANFELSYVDINIDEIKDVLLMYKDEMHCGSGGCQIELCISDDTGFVHIPFGYAAYTVQAAETISNQMHDLNLIGNSNSKMIWDGSQYILAY